MSPMDVVPTPVAGIDPRTRAFTPLQRFVLGHVDGRRSIDDLTKATGVSSAVIDALVRRLAKEGVMRLARRPTREGDDERDSQRPTVPRAPDLAIHERPTRRLPVR